MWLDYANSIACTMLLVFMIPAAVMVSPNRHFFHCSVMLVMELGYAAQIVAPFSADLLPVTTWPAQLLFITQAMAAVIWWREIMLFIRATFDPQPLNHPLRRVSDMMPLDESS